MQTKTSQAIKALADDYGFNESVLAALFFNSDWNTVEMDRVMDDLEYIWSPTRHTWLCLHTYINLDAARRALSAAGKEWARARLELLMLKCGMLSEVSP